MMDTKRLVWVLACFLFALFVIKPVYGIFISGSRAAKLKPRIETPAEAQSAGGVPAPPPDGKTKSADKTAHKKNAGQNKPRQTAPVRPDGHLAVMTPENPRRSPFDPPLDGSAASGGQNDALRLVGIIKSGENSRAVIAVNGREVPFKIGETKNNVTLVALDFESRAAVVTVGGGTKTLYISSAAH